MFTSILFLYILLTTMDDIMGIQTSLNISCAEINTLISFLELLCTFFLLLVGIVGLWTWKVEKNWENKVNFFKDMFNSFYPCFVEMSSIIRTLTLIKSKIRPYISVPLRFSLSDEYEGLNTYIQKYGYSDNESLTKSGLEKFKSHSIRLGSIFLRGYAFNFKNYGKLEQLYKQYYSEYMKVIDIANFLLYPELDSKNKETRDYCKTFIEEFLSNDTEESLKKIGKNFLTELIELQKQVIK